ncbi:MAG: signal peptidase I [Clostridia bacterium]|nr:signal peptidase I [Clostridia bacterium]
MKIRIRNVLFNFLAIVTVAAVAFIGVNLIAGAKGYAVTSNSMAETLMRGDVVFVRQVSFEELMPGDVVTVRSSGDKFHFTHRIVEIDKESRTITTRGDANNADDPMPTQAERIVGKMWYKIPLVGYLSIFFLNFSKTAGLIALAIVAVSLVVMNSVIIKLKSKKKRGDSDE